jgi:UDP:flavonoid glycosyltransferase YjiC (YdhE family)
MKQSKKILFVVEALTFAHVARSATLAAALKHPDYEIVFACHAGQHLKLVETELTGITVRPLKNTVSYEHYLATMSNGRSPYSIETLRDYIEEEMDLLRDTAPDLVIGDLRYSLSISCHRYPVHYVNLVNAIWSPFVRQNLIVPENRLTRNLGVAVGSFLFKLGSQYCFDRINEPFNALRSRYGLAALNNVFDLHCTGDTNLYLDAPSLFEAPSLPRNHKFIGPVLYSMQAPMPASLEKVDAQLPLVFVTMGSSGAVDCLPTLLDCLAKKSVIAVVATSGRAEISNIPSNVYVGKYLPAKEVIQKSSLVISNGGSPVSYLALSEGVPVLAVCSNMDQHLSAQAVQNYGAAISLRSEELNISLVDKCIDKILQESSYRRRARKIASEISVEKTSHNFRRAVERELYPPLKSDSINDRFVLSMEKSYEH